VPLRSRQGVDGSLVGACKQVDDGSEGEPGLELGGATRENAVRTILRRAESCAPERRLADPNRALKDEATRTRPDRRDEIANRHQLGFPSHQPR